MSKNLFIGLLAIFLLVMANSVSHAQTLNPALIGVWKTKGYQDFERLELTLNADSTFEFNVGTRILGTTSSNVYEGKWSVQGTRIQLNYNEPVNGQPSQQFEYELRSPTELIFVKDSKRKMFRQPG